MKDTNITRAQLIDELDQPEQDIVAGLKSKRVRSGINHPLHAW